MFGKADWLCENCGTKSPDVSTTVKDQWCPYCGIKMKRVYEPPLVVLKGSGWTPKYHNTGESAKEN